MRGELQSRAAVDFHREISTTIEMKWELYSFAL
jgi:hypothetical protein